MKTELNCTACRFPGTVGQRSVVVNGHQTVITISFVSLGAGTQIFGQSVNLPLGFGSPQSDRFASQLVHWILWPRFRAAMAKNYWVCKGFKVPLNFRNLT